MHKFLALTLAASLLAVEALAVETRFWQHNEQSDFEKGTLKNLSLRSDGRLTLAPAVTEIFDAATPYLWALARDSKGNLYAGGGGSDAGSARLYKIDAGGKSSTLADLPGLGIQAIAIGDRDRVFAATSPDGKVYEIQAGGKPNVVFEPKNKYIWALAFHGDSLYVAVGSPGAIYKITAGKSSLFFQTDETHVRSLAFDASGNLIAGTDPGGLILRVSAAGEGFVLYQASKSEITALAASADGSVYAAAAGLKSPASAPPAALGQPATVTPVASPVPGAPASISAPRAGVASSGLASRAPAAPGGADVYRIEADGYARKVWSDAQALVYAIAFDPQGHAILGTGNRGVVYRIDAPNLSTRLLDLSPTQITAFCSGSDGALYAATGNVGKVYRIGPALAAEGAFESDALDAGAFSHWGRLSLKPAPAGVGLWTRSGNLDRPQENWSAWQPVSISGDSGVIASPPARFLQYKASLSSAPAAVSSVTIAYLPKNVAPEIQEIEITPPNYKFPPSMAGFPAQTQNLNLPPLGSHARTPSPSIEMGSSNSLSYAKGFAGVRWTASDENSDSLIYKIEIRNAGETGWRPLKDKLKEKYYSWDSTAFADGEYELRITAADEPANPPAQALKGSLVSEPFLIDNTPPKITGAGAAQGGAVHWKAIDALSIIAKAEYSVDGADWQVVEPVTQLSDSREEDYSLTLNLPAGEHVVAIRVTDDFDNQAVAQVTLR
jgi:WD40 repeat protein